MTTENWKVRYDSAIEFKTWEDTPEGYLRVRGTAAATGTMEYKNPDGSPRRELVPPETLAESAPKLKNTPIVVEHPLHLPRGLVDATNVKNYQVGEVIESNFDAETGQNDVELIIRDAKVVAQVKARKLTGLSPGYELNREPAPVGSDYEFIQRDRRYNHLALTKTPRGGSRTVIHLDSADNVTTEPFTENRMDPAEDTKPETKPQGVGLDALVGKIDAFIASTNQRFTALEAPPAPEPAPEVNVDADEAEIAAFKRRAQALAVAEQLEVEFDANTESTDAIRRKIVAAHLGESFDSDATDGYIDAAFAFVQKDADAKATKRTESSWDAIGSAFGETGAGDPNKRSTGFDARRGDDDRKFVPVDPTRLEHERGRNTKPARTSKEG